MNDSVYENVLVNLNLPVTIVDMNGNILLRSKGAKAVVEDIKFTTTEEFYNRYKIYNGITKELLTEDKMFGVVIEYVDRTEEYNQKKTISNFTQKMDELTTVIQELKITK